MRILAFLLGLVCTTAFGAVSGQWSITLLKGSSTLATPTADTQETLWRKCLDLIPTNSTAAATYTCQNPKYIAKVTPTPVCGPAPAPQTRTQACPSGTTGSWTQTLGWNSVPYPTCWETSSWTPTEPPAGSCTPVVPDEPTGALCTGLPALTTTARPMPTVAKPARLVPFNDPVSGARVIRISDTQTQFSSSVTKPAYSTVPAWNIDESYLILYVTQGSSTGHYLFNGKTYEVIKKLDIAPADIEHFYWSGTDPDILYYPWAYEASGVSKREIVRYHVSTGQKETLYAIPNAAAPGAYRVDFGGDPVYGDWSNRVFGLRRRGSSDTSFVWSLANGETPRVPGDAPQITPSGTKYIFAGSLYDSRAQKLRAMKSDTTEHGDMAQLANGQDVWASVQFDKEPKGTLITENLETGIQSVVIGESNGYGYPPTGTHLSGHALKAPGWIGLSVTGNPNGKPLMSQSVLLVNLNDGTKCYAAHHHSAGSDGPNGYWAEPQVNISPRGTRLMFASDWGGGATVDTYVVELPSYQP